MSKSLKSVVWSLESGNRGQVTGDRLQEAAQPPLPKAPAAGQEFQRAEPQPQAMALVTSSRSTSLIHSPLHLFTSSPPHPHAEGGWALFGLILALTVLGIVLVSAITPNYRVAVQREKEAEMLYRGAQMAEGIARYYNRGFLGQINLQTPPAYGHLRELKKLREGVRLGVQEIKFVRPSATIDPMSSDEWEPVYARDPRIMPYLQAWSMATGGIITREMLLLAAAPSSSLRLPSSSGTGGSATGSATGGTSNTAGGQPQPGATGQNGVRPAPGRNNDDDDDDDDNGRRGGNDPLGGFFQGGGNSNAPIVGVAPKAKGPSVRELYGMRNYEEWIFLYLPLNINNLPQQQQQPNQQQRPRIGQ